MASDSRGRFIVLKTLPYGESDLIVRALSKASSKVGFIAKGAKRSRKRFGGGVLQATHFVELSYKGDPEPAEEGRLAFLKEAKLIYDFPKIRSDYDRLQLGLYFVQIYDRVAVEGQLESEYGFDLLGNSLKALETVKNLNQLRIQFEIKFLHQQGVLPPELQIESLLTTPISQSDSLKVQNLPTLQHHIHNYTQ